MTLERILTWVTMVGIVAGVAVAAENHQEDHDMVTQEMAPALKAMGEAVERNTEELQKNNRLRRKEQKAKEQEDEHEN